MAMLVRTGTRNPSRALTRVRYMSLSPSPHSRPQPSAIYFDPFNASEPSVSQTPENLTKAQREELQSALRVDQAGEVTANYIYKGQLAVFQRDPKYGPLIQVNRTHFKPILWPTQHWQEMWDQEKKHLEVMNKMQLQHHVRPTILWEVAQVAGYGLGVVTALMGKEAAMACTEAVETVIGEHYQESVYRAKHFRSQS